MQPPPTSSPDLDAYLSRIGLRGPLAPTLETLETLHLAHLARIPFENVDVRLGRPILLDVPSLQVKLVGARRGGYCFEQNTLFASALRAVGFEVATLEARVRPAGATEPLPRTHMCLGVRIDGTDWLADVGFGGDGTLVPLRFDGAEREAFDGAYRVGHEEGGVHVVQRRTRDGLHDLYAFTTAPALPVDFQVANWYVSTHPRSRFVLTLTVQRSEARARHILRGNSYTHRTPSGETTREIPEAEIPALLRERMALDLPDDLVLRALRGPRTG